MSLTNVYYLVCLGITINCVLVTNCLQQAIALLCGSGWCGCSWQTKNKALLWLTGAFPRPGGPSEPTYIGVALPFSHFSFTPSLYYFIYLFTYFLFHFHFHSRFLWWIVGRSPLSQCEFVHLTLGDRAFQSARTKGECKLWLLITKLTWHYYCIPTLLKSLLASA